MRDMNLTYKVFKEQLEKQSKRKFLIFSSKDRNNILRTPVVNSPTFNRDFSVLVPSRFHEVRGLCLFWEIFPEEIRFEILIELEEKIKKFDFKKQIELKSLLDPEIRYLFLYETKRYSSHEIFGNFLQQGLEALFLVKLKKNTKKVKRPQRKRGYHDKGTLRCFSIWSHKWKPSSDWSLTELQNSRERNQNLQEKYTLKVINSLRIKLPQGE